MRREESWSRSNFSWGTFRCKQASVTSAASSGFDQLSIIALASSRIVELRARLWKGCRLLGMRHCTRTVKRAAIWHRRIGLVACEQCERNRISFRTAACIIRMQMVSTVVIREQLRRVTRIAYNRIEIHNTVEFFAAENPDVDLLSHPFFLRSVESDWRPRRPQIQKRVFEWWIRCADDSNSLLMCP